MISANQHKSKLNFDLFWKENQIFGFLCCSTCEDLSIDVSITIIGLNWRTRVISALRHKTKYKSKFNFDFFWKENQILGFSWCSTQEYLSIDVSITIIGLNWRSYGWFFFSGYGQTDRRTDRHGFRILIWKHVGTAKKFNSKLKISG